MRMLSRCVSDSIDLPDVNVWLALTVADHPHHDRARRYWNEESAERIAFCRITALGFLRLCTNHHVMGGNPLSMMDAWNAYMAFRALPEIMLVAEQPDCERVLKTWVLEINMTPRMWTDAYLAAFAVSSDVRLVSFDADFVRFARLDFLQLER